MHEDIYREYKNAPNELWEKTLCLTTQQPVINGVSFPGFPDPQIQIGMVGSANINSLGEAILLHREVHSYAKKIGFEFNAKTKALDFGCGFGRMLRFFMKDIAPGNLVGTDVDPSFIQLCNDTFSGVRFDVNAPYPPLDYPDASFDFIYAYSVFTHLSEEAHLQWLKELRRIARPGALIFFTLRQINFLKQCQHLRSKTNASAYDQRLAANFGDLEEMMRRYILGECIYFSVGGGGVRTGDFYGDTVLPPRYIYKNWAKYFTIVEIVDERKRMPQAFIVLQPR